MQLLYFSLVFLVYFYEGQIRYHVAKAITFAAVVANGSKHSLA